MLNLEKKLKDSENKRTNQLFEHEKERQEWHIVKDKLVNEKINLADTL